MVYFLIGAQIKGSKQQTWKDIEKIVLAQSIVGSNATGSILMAIILFYIVKIMQYQQTDLNQFIIGNLDSLMFLNDQIIKLDQTIEGSLKKIERTYCDLEGEATHEFIITSSAGNQPIKKYLQNFQWETKIYPRNCNLSDILRTISQVNSFRMHLVDNQLKKLTQEYQEVKNQSQQFVKKEGSILTRDLVTIIKDQLVKPKDFVYSESFTTLIAIVPKDKIQLWQNTYESLHENVVPLSTRQYFNFNKRIFFNKDNFNMKIKKVIHYGGQYFAKNLLVKKNKRSNKYKMIKTQNKNISIIKKNQLHQNNLFKMHVIKKIKIFRIVIKEFQFKPQENQEREKLKEELALKAKNLTVVLKNGCEKGYSDLYVSYIHLKYLKFIIEIAMRFGINEEILACVIEVIIIYVSYQLMNTQPAAGKEKKVQQLLLKLFSDPNQLSLYGTKEELDDSEDFFPFIYVPILIG